MVANRPLPLIEQIKVAAPCPMRWEDLEGDERTRYCAQCNLHVHNISALTEEEAEDLIERTAVRGERLCGVLYRRADGSVMTRDCPVGLAAIRARVRQRAARIGAALGVLLTGSVLASVMTRDGARLRAIRPFSLIADWLAPLPAPPPGPPPSPLGVMVLGEIACPAAPPPPADPPPSDPTVSTP